MSAGEDSSTGETPEELLNKVSPDNPEGEVPEPSRESKLLYAKYQQFETRVHSFTSLASSRDHVYKLLTGLPDHQRIDQSEECIKQELRLQESIRLENYSAADLLSKSRLFVAISCITVPVVLIFTLLCSYIGNAVWGWSIDKDMANILAKVAETFFGGSVITIVAYYFKGKDR